MAANDSTETPVHIEDVIAQLNECAEVFGQMRTLFKTINKNKSGNSEIYDLAGAGAFIASDYENVVDCWKDEIERKGIRGEYLAQRPEDRHAITYKAID